MPENALALHVLYHVSPSLHDGLDEQARNSVRVNLHRQQIIKCHRAAMSTTAYAYMSESPKCQCKYSM